MGTVNPTGRYPTRRSGEISMPLGIHQVSTTGFVAGGEAIDEDGNLVAEPFGTAFLVRMNGDHRNPSGLLSQHFYLVTAGHVAKEDGPHYFWRRLADGTQVNQPIGTWFFHHDDAQDVAVTPFIARGDELVSLPSMDTDAMDAWPEMLPAWGSTVYYVGLFTPGKTMSKYAVPMVRTGTVGAHYVPVDADETNPDSKSYVGHLIDCRSYGGFSGSPVYVQFTYTTDMPDGHDTPPTWPEGWREAHNIGILSYATALWGLLVEHYDDRNSHGLVSRTGVGIVLPVERIRETLMQKGLVTLRRKREAQEKATEKAAGKGQSPGRQKLSRRSEDAGYSENAFLTDLQKVTRPGVQPDREA